MNAHTLRNAVGACLLMTMALAVAASAPSCPEQHPALVQSLVAKDPWPAQSENLRLFGQFVGDWDLEVIYHHDGDRIERRPGEWHFGWILQGRAIQDVWLVPGEAGAPVGYGTTIRMYDPELKTWRVTWHGALSSNVTHFVARPVEGEIVMEAQGEAETFRWIFSEIKPDSFHWRAVSSADGGRSWTVDQEMNARRRR